MPTLLSLLANALGGPDQGVRSELTRSVRGLLSTPAARAIAPILADPTHTTLPDCLTPIGPGQPSVEEQLSSIRDLPVADLERGLDGLGNGHLSPAWQTAVATPRRWLELYADALAAAWQAFAPIWQRSAHLRARETERVGVAVVTDTLDALLTSISARSHFAAESLYLPDRNPYRVALADRRLILMPLVSGATASVFNLDEPEQVWVGYPLPTIDHSPADALHLVLGQLRGAILRALTQPTTMGRLARQIDTRPSTLTYSCRQLENADLVTRQRIGREVYILRTARGDALVDLLARPVAGQ